MEARRPWDGYRADLEAIRQARDSLKRDLAQNSPKEMEEYAEELIRKHQLPESLLRPLTYGLIEAAISGWETAEQRTLGIEPLIFAPSTETAQTREPGCRGPQPQSADPLASSLVEAFGQWGRQSGGWKPGAERQAKVSVRLLLEVCGDRAISAYTRADGDRLRDTLRKLPNQYRKSEKDRDKPLAQIIAEVDPAKSQRVSEKTLKRHFWAVSRFFAFLIAT